LKGRGAETQGQGRQLKKNRKKSTIKPLPWGGETEKLQKKTHRKIALLSLYVLICTMYENLAPTHAQSIAI